jgi:hypothetical protein
MSKEYTFVEKIDSDLYSIKVLEGLYANVIYTYGKVTIEEDIENDVARLKFDFVIERAVAPYTREELETSDEFRNYIGNILSEILNNQDAQIGNATKSTDDNTQDTD